jgi:UrcA family protein
MEHEPKTVRIGPSAFLLLIVAGLMVAFAVSAQAQESDAVYYEFEFEYDSDAIYDPASDQAVQSRLSAEAADYCADLAADAWGVSEEECTAEITGAVNEQFPEPSYEGRFAAN